jgi:NTE family protein
MTTAFVFSGGANLGAVHVGMLKALREVGIHPDFLVGSSVGAVNAAWLSAADPNDGIEGLADIWRALRRKDVFPVRPLYGLAGFLGRRPSLFRSTGLMKLIRANVPFDRLEDAPIPLHVVVTDVLNGRDVAVSTGSAANVIAASAAIPGIFPPVMIDGRLFMDGGVMNNAPISFAIGLGADTIFVLPTGSSCAVTRPPTSAVGMTLHALSLMVNRRLALELEHHTGTQDVRIVPPPCPIAVGPSEFDRADELIDKAYQTALKWLNEGHTKPSTGVLMPHLHDDRPASP